MVEQQVFSVMYDSLENIANYFNDKPNVSWPVDSGQYSIVKASLIRNCLMHNGGVVDKRLSDSFGFSLGSQISLNPDQVHGYGIHLRALARSLYEQACQKHLHAGA